MTELALKEILTRHFSFWS